MMQIFQINLNDLPKDKEVGRVIWDDQHLRAKRLILDLLDMRPEITAIQETNRVEWTFFVPDSYATLAILKWPELGKFRVHSPDEKLDTLKQQIIELTK